MIHDIVITPLRQIGDKRGTVLHMLRCDAPGFTRFGECYFSEVQPGVVKAWKRHQAQTQNLAVPAGRVLLAIYDERASSPSHGVLQTMELGRPEAYLRVRIPPGLWYGFACVGDVAALLANCTDLPHDPLDSESRPSNDPGIPYRWPGHDDGQRHR